MWLKVLQISLVVIFTYSAYGNMDDQCEFASHSKSPYDATDRFESNPCSDETIRASLTTCGELAPPIRQRSNNRKRGDR